MIKGKAHLAGREEPKRSFSKEVIDEAKKNGVPIEPRSLSMDEQQKLLQDDGAPTPSVIDKKMLAKFVRPHFEMVEDDRHVELEFSIALNDEHKELLDPEVLECWKFIEKRHPDRMGIGPINIPPQTIDLYLAPDDKCALHLSGAPIAGAKISIVEKTGDGKTEKITRLQFRIVCGVSLPDVRDKDNATVFAVTKFGNAIWIRMGAAQGVLAASA